MSKQTLGVTDLAKVDAHVIQPREYDEAPELGEDCIEHASRNGLMRVDRMKSLVIYSDLIDRMHALGPNWQARANEALRDWLEKRPEVVALSSPFAARMLTKKQAADYCCAGSLARLDRWRRAGMIPNPPPGTNLFDRHAIDAAIDGWAEDVDAPAVATAPVEKPESKLAEFRKEWDAKRAARKVGTTSAKGRRP